MIAFGQDDLLYIGMGDGGSDDDPQDRAQNKGSLLGKMLRIDPRDPDGSGPRHYSVPSDNPFVAYGGRQARDLGARSAEPVALVVRPEDRRPAHRRCRPGRLGGGRLRGRQRQRPRTPAGARTSAGTSARAPTHHPSGGAMTARASASSSSASTATASAVARSPAATSTGDPTTRPGTAGTSTPTTARAGCGSPRPRATSSAQRPHGPQHQRLRRGWRRAPVRDRPRTAPSCGSGSAARPRGAMVERAPGRQVPHRRHRQQAVPGLCRGEPAPRGPVRVRGAPGDPRPEQRGDRHRGGPDPMRWPGHRGRGAHHHGHRDLPGRSDPSSAGA